MTQLERHIIRALEDTAAQHRNNTEVQLRALNSALDDLIAEQTRLQREAARRLAWLERIAELDDEHDARAQARLALSGDVWPGVAR